MKPGAIAVGRYEVVRRAYRGGMATIYQAIDRETGAPVALKVLRGDDPIDSARFRHEAHLLSELRHPGIVEYVDHGTTLSGAPFLVMEWLEGQDLAQYLRGRQLSIDETLAIARRAAEVLAVAHERELVHRDLKPSNLFLVDGKVERLRLLDFGVAALKNATLDTPEGTTVGTPGYMAPEQARGKPVDARADVFSLGCVLFRCLTRRAPFIGDHPMAVMLKVVLEDPPSLSELRSEVPIALDALVARMLAKCPDERPADATEVLEALSALGTAGEVAHAVRPRRMALTGGEQRLLSVVLVDVRHREDDEEDDGPAPSLPAIARRHGGRFEEIGEQLAVVTLEGRGAASDQAAHAARLALALRRAVPRAPIALATGRGVVQERRPVGEVIDRATVLLDFERRVPVRPHAPAIRVDDVTAGLLDIRFELGGLSFPRELIGERPVRGKTRTLLGRPTPFVGRDRELAELEALFERCAADETARAVVVTAPPGQGKSRLRDELVRRLRERNAVVEVLIGHGDPMRAASAFSVLSRAMRNAAGVLDGEPLPVRQDKLRRRVGFALRGEMLAAAVGFLGELAGVPFPDDEDPQLRLGRRDPIVMGDQIQRAWVQWLAAETEARPVMLVLEDLHWCDRASIRLVDHTLRALGDRPLLVLATARPEVRALFPQLWRERNLLHLELRELSRAASSVLAREVLGGGASDDVISDIAARAAGNAFYLEELIRAVAEGKRGELPETVLAMVQARLEDLDAEARSILRAASVFGRVFWQGGVEHLVGGSDVQARVAGWLTELAHQEVITHRPDGAVPGEEEFVFRHALLRDAAYRTLTPEDRELGHRLAGEWLEQLGEPDASVLADHFERGGDSLRAVRCYRRAAEQALEGNDFDEALARADRALERPAEAEDRGALHLVKAEAHRWLGDHPETLREATDAMRLLRAGTPPWYAAAGMAAIAAGNIGDSERLDAIAADLMAREPGEAVAGRYVVALARAVDRLLGAGRYDQADGALERIEQVLEAIDAPEPVVMAWVRRVRGFRALFASEPARFATEMAASAEAFAAAGDLRYACMQRGNSGYGLIHLGMYDDAVAALDAALAEAERLGLSNVITSVRVDLGYAMALQGKVEEACNVLRDAIRLCVRQGNARLEGPARIYLSTALEGHGDLPGAEREARLAVNVLDINPPVQAGALAQLGSVLLARGRVEEALEVATSARTLLKSFGGIREGESLVHLVYALALDASGSLADSRRYLTVAVGRLLARADTIDDPAWRAAFLERVPANARTMQLVDAWD